MEFRVYPWFHGITSSILKIWTMLIVVMSAVSFTDEKRPTKAIKYQVKLASSRYRRKNDYYQWVIVETPSRSPPFFLRTIFFLFNESRKNKRDGNYATFFRIESLDIFDGTLMSESIKSKDRSPILCTS